VGSLKIKMHELNLDQQYSGRKDESRGLRIKTCMVEDGPMLSGPNLRDDDMCISPAIHNVTRQCLDRKEDKLQHVRTGIT
jgi:hypothetical protein